MRPTATRTFFGYSLWLLLLLCAPGSAHAQPADDPGLSEPVPSPPSKPAATPTPAPPPPAAVQPTQTFIAAPPPAPSETKETVDTQVSWIAGGDDAKKAEGDLYERLAAPTLGGPVGLFRTLTGDSGRSNNFRVGLHLGLFQVDSFLIAGNSAVKGDTNSRFTGDLTIGYTPWKFIELYLALFNASNKNERVDPGRTDPQVILSLGDLALGVKGRYPVTRFLDLALRLDVKFLNSVSGISFDGSSTNFSVDLIGTLDVRHLVSTVPLRFHVNFGYLLDNSLSLLPTGQCALSTGNDACIRSRVVETFAYGIGSQRLRISLAVDAPIAIKSVGLQPFFEYHAEVALGDGDQTVFKALHNDMTIPNDRLTGQSLQYLTLGLRLRPVAGLILDAGLDVGLTSPGFQYGPPVAPWNVILGAAYAYDAAAGVGKTKVVKTTITREVPRGPIEGKVRGVVKDDKTKRPLSGAIVRYLGRRVTPQSTGDDGSFVSYGMAPGPVQIEVSRDDYNTMKVETQVQANGEVPVEVLLSSKPPAAGQVRIRVADEGGQPIVAAQARLSSPQGAIVDTDAEGPGLFTAKLPPGDYSLDVSGNAFLGKQRQVTVTAGQVQTVEVVLRKKPATSHVTLTRTEIVIKGVIHFGTNTAEIKPDGEQILDEVVDVIVKNPQIRRIRVEGHTDNRGIPQKNIELSRARAQAVMAYLVKQGIDPNRLEAEGYGASQPLVPNLSPSNRAKNRRVTFRILDQSTP
jgi:outer membrane protein OmpA-like peptidoglycan-associated protein